MRSSTASSVAACTVGVAVIVVAVVIVVIAAVPAASAAVGVDEHEVRSSGANVAGGGSGIDAVATNFDPCGTTENGSAVVVTPPRDDPAGPGDTVAVYNGSELVVHRCQSGAGTGSLDAEGHDWAIELEDSDDRLRIRVVGPTNDTFGALATPESVPGPSLTIVDHAVSTELADGAIPVGTAEQATELRAAADAYWTAEATLQSRLASLSNATANVESGSTPDEAPIEETIAARERYRSATERLYAELYDVAASSVGGPRSATAIRELENRSATMENRAETHVQSYDAALRDRQESLTWSLRLRIFGLGLLGVAIGATIGAILPIRAGRAARRRVAAGEWTTYSRRALLVPVAVGLVLLGLGLGVLVLTAGDAPVEVMAP